MNTEKKAGWLNPKNIVIFLIGLGCMYLIVTGLIQSRFAKIELNTKVQIANQESILSTIAETTARNGADSVTESIVKDCSQKERSQFESLLDQLNNNLTNAQLTELERLFGRCGSFFSERKSVMVYRFSREIEIYKSYVDQLSIILEEDLSEEYNVSKWDELAMLEQRHSSLFSKLVGLQDKIIFTLINGSDAGSDEILQILQEVREVQENLDITRIQAASIRSDLVKL